MYPCLLRLAAEVVRRQELSVERDQLIGLVQCHGTVGDHLRVDVDLELLQCEQLLLGGLTDLAGVAGGVLV